MGTGEPDQTIPEILPLEQEEYYEYQDEPGRGEWVGERLEYPPDQLHRSRVGLVHLDWDRLGRLRSWSRFRTWRMLLLVLSDLLIDVADELGDPL
jgi:hypothetical protein